MASPARVSDTRAASGIGSRSGYDQVRPDASTRPPNARASAFPGAAAVRRPTLLTRSPSTVPGPGNRCGPKFSQ